MKLTEILNKQSVRRIGVIVNLPPTPKTVLAYKALTMSNGPRPPEPEAAKIALEKIQTAIASGDWTLIKRKDFRRAPYAITDTEECEKLYRAYFFEAYFDKLKTFGHTGAVRGLINTYITTFSSNSRATVNLATKLREINELVPQKFDELQVQYDFFNPDTVAQNLAAAALGSPNPTDELRRAGLNIPNAPEGLSGAALASGLKAVRENLSDPDKNPDVQIVENLFNWIAPNRIVEIKEHSKIIEALLLPFVGRAPEEDFKLILQNKIIEHFEDPRVQPYKSWKNVDDDAQKVLKTWLAARSLEQFLNILSKIAPAYMWERRRKFWSYFIERGDVGNAWVIFGRNGEEEAIKLASETGEEDFRRYGKLIGPADQSVLLMELGGRLIIAEGSHNRSLRIWRKGDNDAPKFYQKYYQNNLLMEGSRFTQIHHASGAWRQNVANYINKEVGIRITPRDYGP